MPSILIRSACYKTTRISKKTVIACFAEGSGTRNFLEKLADDQWDITNFMPEIKVVCAVIYTEFGTNHFSLSLPTLSVSQKF